MNARRVYRSDMTSLQGALWEQYRAAGTWVYPLATAKVAKLLASR